MEEMRRLSIIAVNYNSSSLLKDCLSSIVSNTNDIPLEIIVVDNGSKREEVDNLQKINGNVRIIFKEENSGYSKAVNEGIKNASGEFILITNPDVLYMPYSIKNMMEAFASLPRCGAVGPKTWWDKEMTFMLPFSEIVTPFRILRTELMVSSPILGDMILKNWIKRSLKYWLSESPLVQEMLSGACIMTTREVLWGVGGFDEIFPLYFEDTDWCLRVRKAGYNLYMLPDAEIIHYYNQSARQEINISQEKFSYSSIIYLKKHFNLQFILSNYIKRVFKYINKRTEGLYEDMGIVTTSPVFKFKDRGRKLILLSPVETMIPSAGAFLDGDSFEIRSGPWNSLAKGRYFIRAFEFEGLSNYGAWSWVKDGD